MNNIHRILMLDAYAITPKHQQLSDCILRGIRSGKIKMNDLLPSINMLSAQLNTNRSTIERAYNELKSRGIVSSVAGKGYYITQTSLNKPVKIIILFNILNQQTKQIYDALTFKLRGNAVIDFHIYHNDFLLFKKIIKEKSGYFDKFLIIPHFNNHSLLAYDLIGTLSRKKLILLDSLPHELSGKFGAVFQDFENDLFSALEQLTGNLAKYQTIKLVLPGHTYFSSTIIQGLSRFSEKHNFKQQIIYLAVQEIIEPGCVYIALTDDDLVVLVEKIVAGQLEIGKDLGLISYHETPIKKVILRGITTLTSNFKLMGELAADLVLENKMEKLSVPYILTIRDSL